MSHSTSPKAPQSKGKEACMWPKNDTQAEVWKVWKAHVKLIAQSTQ